jgi:hypothetical protein
MHRHPEASDSVRPLTPWTERSFFDHAIRVADGADPVDVLVQAVTAASAVSTRWDCTVVISVEPDGDACETGHFVEIEVHGAAVWADLTRWPARFGGAIPHRLLTELGLAGWVMVREGGDPDPIDSVCKVPELMTDDDRAVALLPAPRLVVFTDTDDVRSWAVRVAHAIERVLAPRSSRWFLESSAQAETGGALADHPRNASGADWGHWAFDLGEVIEPHHWERAIWPADSEGAWTACRLGLHQYHERPCPHPRTAADTGPDDETDSVDDA